MPLTRPAMLDCSCSTGVMATRVERSSRRSGPLAADGAADPAASSGGGDTAYDACSGLCVGLESALREAGDLAVIHARYFGVRD